MKTIESFFAEPCPRAPDEEAQAFSRPFGRDFQSWWANAPLADWTIWLAHQCGVEMPGLVDAALKCVLVGYRFIPDAEEQLEPLVCIAEKGVRGDASRVECRAASDHAHAYQKTILD